MKKLSNNRYFVAFTFFIVSLHSIVLSAQCPTITNSSFNAGCIGAGTPCTLCSNQTITLSASGTSLTNGGCVKWYYSQTSGFNPYNGEGTYINCGLITGSNIANVSFQTTDAMCNNGTYYVVGILDPLDLTNCSQVFTNEFNFTVDCPIATVSALDSPYCERYPVNFFATGGVSYHWEGPQGFSSNDQNFIITYANYFTNSGTYYVTVTDALGCKVIKSKEMLVEHIFLHTEPFPPEVVTFCEGGFGTVIASILGGDLEIIL